jgi:hypothetical protein
MNQKLMLPGPGGIMPPNPPTQRELMLCQITADMVIQRLVRVGVLRVEEQPPAPVPVPSTGTGNA